MFITEDPSTESELRHRRLSKLLSTWMLLTIIESLEAPQSENNEVSHTIGDCSTLYSSRQCNVKAKCD